MSSPLSLREDTKKGKKSPKNSNNQGEIYVQGISEFHVQDVKETLHLLKTAEKNRKIRETALNLFSSRSHSIFQVWTWKFEIKLSFSGFSICNPVYQKAGMAGWPVFDPIREHHIVSGIEILKIIEFYSSGDINNNKYWLFVV